MAEMKTMTINGTQFTLPFAPAGYGLGGVAKPLYSTDDINNIKTGGRYTWGSSVPANAPLSFCMMDVMTRNDSTVIQVIYTISDAAGKRCTLIRHSLSADTWDEFEWDNPPMVLGVEYRTTERYNGAPVYTKLIDLGNMPSNGSGKWVEHGTGSQTPIRVCGRIPSYTLPLRTPSDEITISVTSDYVLVFAPASNATDWTGSTGQAQIWYTK